MTPPRLVEGRPAAVVLFFLREAVVILRGVLRREELSFAFLVVDRDARF